MLLVDLQLDAYINVRWKLLAQVGGETVIFPGIRVIPPHLEFRRTVFDGYLPASTKIKLPGSCRIIQQANMKTNKVLFRPVPVIVFCIFSIY